MRHCGITSIILLSQHLSDRTASFSFHSTFLIDLELFLLIDLDGEACVPQIESKEAMAIGMFCASVVSPDFSLLVHYTRRNVADSFEFTHEKEIKGQSCLPSAIFTEFHPHPKGVFHFNEEIQ